MLILESFQWLATFHARSMLLLLLPLKGLPAVPVLYRFRLFGKQFQSTAMQAAVLYYSLMYWPIMNIRQGTFTAVNGA
jgi:hypothetical protein